MASKSGVMRRGVRPGDRLALTEEMFCSLLEEITVIWLCSNDSAKYWREAEQ